MAKRRGTKGQEVGDYRYERPGGELHLARMKFPPYGKKGSGGERDNEVCDL